MAFHLVTAARSLRWLRMTAAMTPGRHYDTRECAAPTWIAHCTDRERAVGPRRSWALSTAMVPCGTAVAVGACLTASAVRNRDTLSRDSRPPSPSQTCTSTVPLLLPALLRAPSVRAHYYAARGVVQALLLCCFVFALVSCPTNVLSEQACECSHWHQLGVGEQGVATACIG